MSLISLNILGKSYQINPSRFIDRIQKIIIIKPKMFEQT